MGCTFCATGTMGLMSNLTAGEILEQVAHANKIEKIRNVVFMGMGEPLDNYKQVLAAASGMMDVSRFSLSPARISISTVGVVPRILNLIQDLPQVGLAISLHAPNQELRSQIVPTSKAWHISKIMAATDAFIANQNKDSSKNRKKHIMIEYVLIANINDSVDCARELGLLLQGKEILLNVIPYNPTKVPFDYKSPSQESIDKFVETVRSYSVHTILRQGTLYPFLIFLELGQDIASACGQLVVETGKLCSTSKDMEDLVKPLNESSKRITVKKRTKESISQDLVSPSNTYPYALAFICLVLALRITWRFIEN